VLFGRDGDLVIIIKNQASFLQITAVQTAASQTVLPGVVDSEQQCCDMVASCTEIGLRPEYRLRLRLLDEHSAVVCTRCR
jgi:hypothetical protein